MWVAKHANIDSRRSYYFGRYEVYVEFAKALAMLFKDK